MCCPNVHKTLAAGLGLLHGITLVSGPKNLLQFGTHSRAGFELYPFGSIALQVNHIELKARLRIKRWSTPHHKAETPLVWPHLLGFSTALRWAKHSMDFKARVVPATYHVRMTYHHAPAVQPASWLQVQSSAPSNSPYCALSAALQNFRHLFGCKV